MDEREKRLEQLEEENRQLKADMEVLLDTLIQMNRTLNRLLDVYVAGGK